jgi:anaerobic dimethyl sulfoxide reductase subunit C (anchor subunit)
MNVHDWALVAFTILAQMSVGSFLVLGVVHFFAARKYGMAEADRLSDRALLAIGPVMVLALVASLFHLGSPLNAYRAVTNLGSSWLSREILTGVLFTVAGAVFAFVQWRKLTSYAMRNVIAWIAAILGLVFVFAMSNVYLLPSQPAWDTLGTPVAFFVTTFLLGALAMGVAFVANYAYIQRKNPGDVSTQSQLLRSSLRWIGLASVVLLGIELVVAPLQVTYLASGAERAGNASVALLFSQFGVVFGLRLALVFIGAGILGLFVYQNAQTPGREHLLGYLAYAAFALVLISEVMGRFLFYAAHIRIGV